MAEAEAEKRAKIEAKAQEQAKAYAEAKNKAEEKAQRKVEFIGQIVDNCKKDATVIRNHKSERLDCIKRLIAIKDTAEKVGIELMDKEIAEAYNV